MIRDLGHSVIRDVGRLIEEGTSTGSSDEQLLSRFTAARDRSSPAFEAIVRRHGPMVLETCRRLLDGDQHAAEDAFQATFLVLARRRRCGITHPSGSLGPWLHEVACRTARKARVARIRREKRELSASRRPDAIVAASRNPVDDADDHRILHEEVSRAAGEAPRRDRPLLLRGLDPRTGRREPPLAGRHRPGVPGPARDLLRTRLVRRGVAPAVAIGLMEGRATAALPPLLIETVVRGIAQVSAGSTRRCPRRLDRHGLWPSRGSIDRCSPPCCWRRRPVGRPLSPRGPAIHRPSNPRPRQPRSNRPGGMIIRFEGSVSISRATRSRTEPSPGWARSVSITGTRSRGSPTRPMVRNCSALGGDEFVRVWDSATGRLLRTITIDGGRRAHRFALAPDGKSLFSAELQCRRSILSGLGRRDRPRAATAAHPRAEDLFLARGFSPDGKTLIDRPLRQGHRLSRPVTFAEVPPDEAASPGTFATWRSRPTAGCSPGRARIDCRTWKAGWAAAGRSICPAGRRPRKPSERSSLVIWDVARPTELLAHRHQGHPSRSIWPFRRTEGPRRAVLRRHDPFLRRRASGHESARIEVDGCGQMHHGLLAGRPGPWPRPMTRMAAATATIHLWDLPRKAEIRRLSVQHDPHELVFSPDGKTLASAGQWEKLIRLWDVDTGRETNAVPTASDRASPSWSSPPPTTPSSPGASTE